MGQLFLSLIDCGSGMLLNHNVVFVRSSLFLVSLEPFLKELGTRFC